MSEELEIEELLNDEYWELATSEPRLFSSDQLVDAYLRGKKAALEQDKKLQLEKLIDNLDTTAQHAFQLVTRFEEAKITPIGTYLKINSWNGFNIILLIKGDDFLSSEILPLYNYIGDFEDSVRDDFYTLEVHITGVSDSFNQSCLASDGYILKLKIREED